MPKDKIFIRAINNKHGAKQFVNVNGQTVASVTGKDLKVNKMLIIKKK